jgi:hypothetical protein
MLAQVRTYQGDGSTDQWSDEQKQTLAMTSGYA